jgi:hypothetical protein
MLVRNVTADHAPGRGAQYAMAAGIMTGNAADNRSLDAAFGFRRDRRCRHSERQQRSSQYSFHVVFPPIDGLTAAIAACSASNADGCPRVETVFR